MMGDYQTLYNMKKLFKKYKDWKNSIDTSVGKKVEKIFSSIVIIITFLIIPIFFTLLSTLAGSGTITFLFYNIVFYITLIMLIISLIIWVMFLEFKNKQIN